MKSHEELDRIVHLPEDNLESLERIVQASILQDRPVFLEIAGTEIQPFSNFVLALPPGGSTFHFTSVKSMAIFLKVHRISLPYKIPWLEEVPKTQVKIVNSFTQAQDAFSRVHNASDAELIMHMVDWSPYLERGWQNSIRNWIARRFGYTSFKAMRASVEYDTRRAAAES